MADVLSQNEIDELLSAISTGVVSAENIKQEQKQKKIKLYDFKRPDKFSKDQIRTLYMLHENFARLLNTYLSAHLRTMVQVSVASVDQLTYEEFIRSRIPAEDLLGMLHYNTEVIDADRQGKSPYDFSQTVTAEITKIKEKIDQNSNL